jgi:hypothetical protein
MSDSDLDKRTYAEVIRDLEPLDDDLLHLGAPAKAIQMVQSLFALCKDDFEARYGVGFFDALPDDEPLEKPE